MELNHYWTVYRNLEEEFLELSRSIHIDDNQLNVYSIKICELVIRTVVEVESLSKHLYFTKGGDKKDNNQLFFDTDCIDYLESLWKLSKKKVLVSSPHLYLEEESNTVLTPLKKANKRGSSSSDWLRAYQAIKHNRAANLKKGSLKHLLRGLGGLFILNLYLKDNTYPLGSDANATNFDGSLGSKLFSIKTHVSNSYSLGGTIVKGEDYDECTYIVKPTQDSLKQGQEAVKKINQEFRDTYSQSLNNEIEKRFPKSEMVDSSILKKEVEEITKKIKEKTTSEMVRKNFEPLKKVGNLSFEGALNKQQNQD